MNTTTEQARVSWTVEKRGVATRKRAEVTAAKLGALLARIERADGFNVTIEWENLVQPISVLGVVVAETSIEAEV